MFKRSYGAQVERVVIVVVLATIFLVWGRWWQSFVTDDLLTLLMVGLAIDIIVEGVIAFIKTQKAVVLDLDEQGIFLQGSLMLPPRTLTYEAVFYMGDLHYSYWNGRHKKFVNFLCFFDAKGKEIDRLNLDCLAKADVNQIRKAIQARAPHIRWTEVIR